MIRKVQLPVVGGNRKVVIVPSQQAQQTGTTISEFANQEITLAQLKAALGITTTKANSGGTAPASLVVGPGLSGGGVLTGAVPLNLLPTPVVWNEPLLPDDWIGSGGGGGGASALAGLSDVAITSPATGQVLEWNGTKWTNQNVSGGGGGSSSLVYVNTTIPAGNTIANTTTATAFSSSYTISANSLAVGSVIRVVLRGVYSSALTAPTISIALKLGSTTVLTTGVISPLIGSATNDGWSYEALLVIQAVGVSGSVEAQGTSMFQTAANDAAVVPMENTAAITVDTTVAETITATVTWGTASTSNTVTLREMAVWIQNASGTSTSLPGTINDLLFWLRGDQVLGTNGTSIPLLGNATPWLLGPLASLTSGTVTVASSQLNSLNTLQWPGNSGGRYGITYPVTLSKVTIFAVLKSTSSSNQTLVGAATGGLEMDVNTGASGVNLTKSFTAVVGSATTALTSGTWYQLNATYDSGSGAYAFRIAQAAAGSGTNALSITTTTTGIGYNVAANGNDLSAAIAELIIYGRVLSNSEILAVEAYLHSKWGV